MFWSYLDLGVTLQLLSLLSLAGWAEEDSAEAKEEGRQEAKEETEQ